MTEQLGLFDPALAPPVDAAARDAIRGDLDTTLFVEAGAGSGKTAVLVDRVVALAAGDGSGSPVPMRNIAAITFTEKAAGELRDRVRTELAERGCDAALAELDAAAICTLHSFAQRILTQFPIEVGLPPRIEVRDEISSRVAFEARWRVFVDELLEDPALESTVLVMLAAGVRLPQLRAVAEVLNDNWDLLARVGEAPELPAIALDTWFAGLDAICARTSECKADTDGMLTRIEELARYGDRLRNAFDDVERVRLLRLAKPSFRVGNTGRSAQWSDLPDVREQIARLGAQRDAIVNAVLDMAIKRVVVALARGTTTAVAERRAAGELEFHDLLVLARSLLRDPKYGPRARAQLRERYRRLLIDEFQDTDPIQVELAALLGSGDPDDCTRPWQEIVVDPGRLFFVGDPKQSIYRFRRADIATFLAAADAFAEPAPLHLTCNFRTAPRVLAWINAVFAELIAAHPGSQPEYRALDAARADGGDGQVMLLGVDAHEDGPDADELRVREAGDVATAIRRMIADRAQVFDRDTESWRDARLGDICILLPARTSLGFLERALEDVGVPYRAESSSLVYSTREVRDLISVLRAIDDPSDELALVTALRSSLFGCGDDDLYTFHVEHRGHWDLRRDVPTDVAADHPVAEAFAYLRDLHAARLWAAPSELLERIVRERRVLEVGAMGYRFRDVARRVRFIVDQARAFADAQGGTLRDYLAWVTLQSSDGARVVEAVLPETDDDAVRILTVHGAKGLEFPIVICSGATTAAVTPPRGVQVLFPGDGGYEVKLSKGVQTAHFELRQPIDEQMDFHEKLRLLYVACTRARDHLVVSVHRKVRELPVERTRWTHAELLWNAAQEIEFASPPSGRPLSASSPRSPEPIAPGPEPAAWESERTETFAQGARRAFVGATTLARRGEAGGGASDPGLAKDGRDLELPPWNKGRYGTAVGRAVHAVLQTVDLATGAGIDDAAAAQAAAEGVLGHEPAIAALARSAIASTCVQRASVRPRWREMYVAVPLADLVLEGYVDLVFRDDDGLVVVDYKTDAVGDDGALDERLAHYQVQIGAYAHAIQEATGKPVVRGILCFLDPDSPREVVIEGDDLSAAIADVHARARAERDDPSPLPAATLVDA